MGRLHFTILGIVCILLGGLIYILWRPSCLLMFNWFTEWQINGFIKFSRDTIILQSFILPKWMIYSLPNALWAFGGIIIFAGIWGNKHKEFLLWSLLFSAIAIFAEFGQFVHILPGTFDYIDFALISVAVCGAFYITNRYRKKE